MEKSKGITSQTAVEWLYQILTTTHADQQSYNELFDQAKAMEKEQIEEAFIEGGIQYLANIADDYPPRAKDYYNKTYAK